jgi:hypothetical protein
MNKIVIFDDNLQIAVSRIKKVFVALQAFDGYRCLK